ncbi:MAG: tetraacyldisaccharide 4'-kinase [Bacteroidia bacterium]|nr:MAG: tetraacyldisaccharide 4'-kinase [Bacteroidia bacterium]
MQASRQVWEKVKALFRVGIGLPLALVYGLVVRLRNWLYDRELLPVHRVPCAVVSIGNLNLGGSGKTPFALFLLEWLQSQGLRAAYLSRGYRRTTRGYQEVDLQAPEPARSFGDEAVLVKSVLPSLPVAVCADRVAGAQTLLQRYPDLQVLVLDDAFQHRRLHRDLDILLLDADRPPWRDGVFPVGRLREPFSSYRRAHLLIYNHKSNPSSLKPRALRKPLLPFRYAIKEARSLSPERPPLSPEALRYKTALAFCGIAHPASFYQTLQTLPLHVPEMLTFPDHHPYTAKDLYRLRRTYEKLKKHMHLKELLLLTTEKDLARLIGHPALPQLEDLPLYAVAIRMEPVDAEKAFRTLETLFMNLKAYDHTRSL